MTAGRQLTFWAGAFVLLMLALYVLGDILLPFVAGMAIAYFLDPAADKLEGWGLPRWAAATVLTTLFLLAVVAFLLLLVPLLQSQIVNLIDNLPRYVEQIRAQLNDLLALIQARLDPEDLQRLRDAVGGLAGNTLAWLGRVVGRIWSGGVALLNLLSLIFITPIVAFYLLRDWDRIVARMDQLLPRSHAEVVREQIVEIDRTLSGFARGQALVCLLLGLFYAVALTAAGLEFGLIVGLATGLVTFIPYFGMIFGLLVSLGLAFAQFDDWLRIGLVAAIFIIGQVIEGNFITPKLVGDRVGLHPVWMIFALLAGGALFGFVGVLAAVPLAATIGVLMRFAIKQYQASPLYRPEAGVAAGDGRRDGE